MVHGLRDLPGHSQAPYQAVPQGLSQPNATRLAVLRGHAQMAGHRVGLSKKGPSLPGNSGVLTGSADHYGSPGRGGPGGCTTLILTPWLDAFCVKTVVPHRGVIQSVLYTFRETSLVTHYRNDP